MALITCTECGKRFSDKAACCPECGCPTEEIVGSKKAAAPTLKPKAPAVPAVSKESQAAAEQKMRLAVSSARSELRSALNTFDRSNDRIQLQASRPIDLFGGSASRTVVEIAAEARRACDELYSSCQASIARLDRTCRPLLDSKPASNCIQEVAKLIAELNEESEVESNFTASFNGAGLGDVANSRYVPSISSRMAQKFWESAYSDRRREELADPDFQRRQREREERERKEREELRKQEAERRKEEEARKKAEKERQDKEGVERKALFTQVSCSCNQAKSAYHKAVEKELDKQKKQLRDQLDAYLCSLEQQKEAGASGSWRGREKKEKKLLAQLLEQRIRLLSAEDLLQETYDRMEEAARKAVADYDAAIAAYLKERFPEHASKKDNYHRYVASSKAKTTVPAAPAAAEAFQEWA